MFQSVGMRRRRKGRARVPSCVWSFFVSTAVLSSTVGSTKQSRTESQAVWLMVVAVAVAAVAVRCRSFSPKWVVSLKRKRIKRAMSEA